MSRSTDSMPVVGYRSFVMVASFHLARDVSRELDQRESGCIWDNLDVMDVRWCQHLDPQRFGVFLDVGKVR